jgi:hypothetical protein
MERECTAWRRQIEGWRKNPAQVFNKRKSPRFCSFLNKKNLEMISTGLFTAALLAAQASAYSLCNPTEYVYKGRTVRDIPLVRGPTLAVNVNGTIRQVSVTGSISVVDGCSVSDSPCSSNL